MTASTALASPRPAPPRLPGRYSEAVAEELRERPPKSKGERTKRRLEYAALRVLETNGYSDSRVADICREAGVSLGTFYVYYTDKKDIASNVLLEFGEALYQHGLSKAVGRTAYDAILLTNRFFVQAYDQNRGLIRCLVQVDDIDAGFQEAWRHIRQGWTRRIAASIAKRSGPGTLSEATRIQIASALEGMMFHFLYDLFVREEPHLTAVSTDLDQVAELLSLLWYRGLYAANPPNAPDHELTRLPLPQSDPGAP